MKCFALFLSLMVVTAAFAQKPLDRGIHKRKTGGVSLLFGKRTIKAEGHAKANAFGELVSLEILSPAALPVQQDLRVLLVQARQVNDLCSANETRATPDEKQRMSLLSSNRIGLVAGPVLDKRLFRRAMPSISRTRPNSDSLDWVSLLAMLLATLGLVATGFVMGWWGGFLKGADTLALWFLSLGFLLGFLGLRRTRRGKRRGGILALVSFVVGAILPSTAIILLIALLTGNFSIPF
jgi:hypothetical protein